TVLDAEVPGVEQGNRMLVKPDGATDRSLGDADLDRAAHAAALELLKAERSEVRTLPGSKGEARAFVEVLEPPLRLLVCGAGHDAAPLVEAAANLGWSPIVVDDRPEFLNRGRFPDAADFVLVERPD